jgi:hypothetical protein
MRGAFAINRVTHDGALRRPDRADPDYEEGDLALFESEAIVLFCGHQ